MHAVVIDSLEEYLGGSLAPEVQREFESHLKMCDECRLEVQGMQDMNLLFSSLRTEEILTPSPGFYAGVVRAVGGLGAQRTPSFASLFALDFAFGRRLVFASLLTLAVLGSYLVSREVEYTPGPTPESVMAQDNASPDRDHMLVTLTSYEP